MGEPGPVARYRMETTEPEQAHAWLTEYYTAHVPRLTGDRNEFRMRLTGMCTDLVRFDELEHSLCTDAAAEPFRALVVVRVLQGRFRVRGDSRAIDPGTGGPVLLDPFRPTRCTWDAIRSQGIRLDLEAVRTIAEGISGVPANRVRFELSSPVDALRALHWTRTARHVVQDVLARDDVVAQPLVRASAFRMLTTAALSAFPNTAMERLADRPLRGTADARPAVLRRAVAFIESAADRDIGTVEIAEAARISVRGLQHAFRRHLACTPLEYLKRVRLDGARRDLRHGDPTRGVTVASVAARWGFTHPGRFAVEYRRVHGCSPRDTLHH